MTSNERAGQTDQETTKEDQSFTVTQHQKLEDLIAQAVAAAMMIQQVSNAEKADSNENKNNIAEDLSNSTNSTDLTMPVTLSQLTHWKADKISLFNSHLNKSHEEGEIVTVRKDIYYWSVMLFIECIWDMTTIKEAQLVRMNLNICLWEASLIWYISELFNLERVDLWNNENSVEKWCWVLKNWFKELAAVIFASFTSTKYIMTDAQNHWESSIYV